MAQVLAIDRSSSIRVRHDRPRANTQMAKESPELMPFTSMVVHDVPELETGAACEKHMHDVQQWRWLSSQMALGASGAISIFRLPRFAYLTLISSPKLLSVTFNSPEQLAIALQRRYETKAKMGGHIRCSESRPQTIGRQQTEALIRPQDSVALGLCSPQNNSLCHQSVLPESTEKTYNGEVLSESANYPQYHVLYQQTT
ncbi:unnamed protein product [Trichobilharzia szidati]|nr:unnamed protein product [Trichobilharzia szidati]